MLRHQAQSPALIPLIQNIILTIQATTTEEHANYENTGISNSKIHLLLQFGGSRGKEYYQILVTMSRH